MIDRLRAYIDELFAEAPATKKTVEVKEEILQNLSDKYNDLIAEGKSEEAAYNISVASIGDISELIEELKKNTEAMDSYISDPERQKERKRSAMIVSYAIMLYILSVVPLLILQNIAGLVVMFVFIAAATGMLIYNGMTKAEYKNNDETIASEFKEWRETNKVQKSAIRSLTSSLWALTIIAYFLISFWTRAWHISWLIFFVSFALQNIIRVYFDTKK
ncbi:MAG: hypothetical protein GX111_06175 [Clostridiales bacterium]|nr:hypothetical protein [Clostridiales bacterium]